MPLLGYLQEEQRRSQTICLLIDTSKGINDNCEKKLYAFMEELYDSIRMCAKEKQDVKYSIDVLLYGDNTYWYTASGPEPIEDFLWDAFISNGRACPDKAFELLDDRLDKYFKNSGLSPIIFLVNTNKVTGDYDRELTILKLNRSFQKAIKLGISMGHESDNELLEQFTGTKELIFYVNEMSDRIIEKILHRQLVGTIADQIEPLPRLDIFYVVDTSEEMSGAKIDALNQSLKEMMISLSYVTPSANMYFNILKYGGSPEWIVKEASTRQILKEWKDLEVGGSLKINQALEMLLERLQVYSLNKLDDYMPVIILVNSNKAEEVDRNVLEQLQKVVWFKHALKIGFGVGDNPDMKMLAAITGNMEAVISTSDLDLFRRLYTPRKVGDYLECIPDMEDIPSGKIQASRPSISTEIHLPSGKVFVDENLLAVKKCQIRACKLEEADDILFSICYTTVDDWEGHLYVTNVGKENLIVRHTIRRCGETIVLSGPEKECEYLIEQNKNSIVHNRFSIGVSVLNDNLIIKNGSNDLVTVSEIINPGETVKMERNSTLLLSDGTICFELSMLDDDWW